MSSESSRVRCIPRSTASSAVAGSRPVGAHPKTIAALSITSSRASGRKQLEVETDSWQKLTAAVAQILENV